jgi:thiosulfate/3-mercaptopyruvate sulfurtransferase
MKTLIILMGTALFAQIPTDQTINADQFAARLKQTSKPKPLILQTGFPVLFRAAHIDGSIYVGPDSKPEGIEKLKETVAKEPHDREIVIYCGCCPWDKCPNIRPAFAALREMGFTRVSALHIPDNLAKDWIDKGYPTDGRQQDKRQPEK